MIHPEGPKTMEDTKRVAIIGSAGRGPDSKRMSKELYSCMVERALRTILDEWQLEPRNVVLVSGGSSFSDHVAVSLYHQYSDFKGIALYLPCGFDKGQFKDTGQRDWRTNPGNYLNYLHKQFSRTVGLDSLKQIATLETHPRARLDTSSSGFHQRNALVARSDYILAFTFGQGSVPADGGTAHTWSKAPPQARKKHVSLLKL